MSARGFNGVDRRDNSRGYVKGNMLPACWTCNKMKGKLSYQDFVAAVQNAAKHLQKAA
jgi:hypothetical protein